MHTKYDLGQTVYFEHLGGVDKGVIHRIDAGGVGANGVISRIVRYYIEGLTKYEEYLYDTPDECLATLIAQQNRSHELAIQRLHAHFLRLKGMEQNAQTND